ncbi:MAG: TIGR04295 family B12-binding domain-containing radical SAM protein [Acetobacteraceae bacterium]|nr:TIGR04295 family B12-binding domain-containing radical SAM protein [Acetobacteraceae bacterium]
MRVALLNPPWGFENSVYFGCREPHLPLELGYARALLERDGHEVLLRDGYLSGMSIEQIAEEVGAFHPKMTVVTTAPSYLFWRCAQPELRVPRALLAAIEAQGGMTVAVGPHGSSTPGAARRKLGCDLIIRGECEEVIAELANGAAPETVSGTASADTGGLRLTGAPRAARFTDLPALRWPDDWIARHHHHHHRFDLSPATPGAEVEASRGCPYSCTFCAKIDYRDRYRRRDLARLLEEIDALRAQGVTYIYFIDEIFLPDRPLLEALLPRGLAFGVQTRIDLWPPQMIELLGRAGCVSIEAGVESLTESGRASLDKKCRKSTDQLAELLIFARRHVSFVQANLLATDGDDRELVAAWRERLARHDVWSNDPVPLFPYPSSPDYVRRWGKPDEHAWERAHASYLAQFDRLSDIQADRPAPLAELEAACLS